jgi:hypothetical protein
MVSDRNLRTWDSSQKYVTPLFARYPTSVFLFPFPFSSSLFSVTGFHSNQTMQTVRCGRRKIQTSQGKVEYKARSILETLYSMRDIKLSALAKEGRQLYLRLRYLCTDVWRRRGRSSITASHSAPETLRGEGVWWGGL